MTIKAKFDSFKKNSYLILQSHSISTYTGTHDEFTTLTFKQALSSAVTY